MSIGRTLQELPSSVVFTTSPDPASIAQAAALNAYGVSVAKIQQAQGDMIVTAGCILCFVKAALVKTRSIM